MAARMNLQSRSNDTNPYAAPESRDHSAPTVELPPGSPWTIDGEALLCRGDLTFDWLCFSTGLPVEPDAKVFYMKIFAPSQQRRIVFRLFHSLSIATILILLVLGRIMQAGPVKIFGVPAFVFVLAHIAIFIIILRRTPSFRIYYRRSPEGRRRHLVRRTIPSLAAGMLILGPALIVLPQLFAASFGWGIVTLSAAIMAFAGFMMLLPEPRAVSLNEGVYRVTYLTPELLAALKNQSDQR
jgi:hypothetical protein